MTVRLDEPVWVWALGALVLLTLIGARWLLAMTGVRRAAAVLVRVVLGAVLVAALADLSTVRRSEALAVVAVVDTSGSARRYYRGAQGEDATAQAAAFLRAAGVSRGPDDLLGIVAFDAAPVGVRRPTRAGVGDLSLDVRTGEGTNIAEALRLARAMIPPGAAGRLVLISDGVQTAGDALTAAQEAPGAGVVAGTVVPVDVVPLEYSVDREVAIEAVDAPATAAAGSTVSVRVALSSTQATTGTLRLLRNGESVDISPGAPGDGLAVALEPGLRVERVEVPLGEGRVHRFRAVFEPALGPDDQGGVRALADTIEENNRGEAFTVSPGRGSVLLVGEPESLSSRTLAGVLRAGGADVRVTAPAGLSADLLALQAHDLVILNDVPAEDVPDAVQLALRTHVNDLGGGLVYVGGLNSYAPGGWRGSTLEPVLPVDLEVPDVVVTPDAATIFVLDNSGSMWRPVLGSGRSQQELANDAAALAVRSMDRRDLVGVVTFNTEATLEAPLAPNDDPPALVRTIRGISSGGGTNAPAGMEIAIAEMRRAGRDAKVRHIVLLTDGVSQAQQRLVPLAEQCAAEGIKVSTIAVGDSADNALLRRMASVGGGEHFEAQSAAQLPRLLLKAVRIVRSPLIREEPFTPVVLGGGSAVTAGLDAPPILGGLVLTRPRTEPGITLAMTTPRGEPVLAIWNVGLGQVAAWTSDAGAWSRAWIDDPAYARLWTQILRTVGRAPESPTIRGESESGPEGIRLRLVAQNPDATPMDALAVDATVFAPSGEARTLVLSQVAPGVYEGLARVRETGTHVAVIRPTRDGRPLPASVVGSTVLEGVEYRARSSDAALLERIARASGGRVLSIDRPADAALFERTGVPPRESVSSLWRPLLSWALALLLLDIATRRIAWDRWISRRFNPDLLAAERLERERALAAGRTVGGLRAGRLRAEDAPPAGPALTLGANDAAALAAAARDRRRAERLAGLRA
ncbi:MAG: VWA domain-containing protein, partial [Planctomycetota bacterium]|nr:VWA domain-containing protein [Planctomycetota bacterium]